MPHIHSRGLKNNGDHMRYQPILGKGWIFFITGEKPGVCRPLQSQPFKLPLHSEPRVDSTALRGAGMCFTAGVSANWRTLRIMVFKRLFAPKIKSSTFEPFFPVQCSGDPLVAKATRLWGTFCSFASATSGWFCFVFFISALPEKLYNDYEDLKISLWSRKTLVEPNFWVNLSFKSGQFFFQKI